MSRTIDMTKRDLVIKTLVEHYPYIMDSGIISHKDISAIITPVPVWIKKDVVSRGIYNISAYISKLNHKEDNNITQNTSIVENVVSIATHKPTMEIDKSHFIPTVDPNYVPFGNYKDLEKIIVSKLFYPVYLTGPTGNGKSSSIEQICARKKIPLIRVNINMMSDEDQLIGTKTLEDGNIKIVEGPILQAMRMGCIILIDECLSEKEKIRVGTVDNWVAMPLSEFEFGVNYPIVSFNMETGTYENDEGTIISEKDDDLYEVELEDGSIIVLNGKHPFITHNGEEYVQKSIDDGLTEGDYVVVT